MPLACGSRGSPLETAGRRDDTKNKQSVTCKDKILPVVLLGCSLAALAQYAHGNLDYPGFWWDETAQFWISQGISHYAEPWTAPRGLADALRLNRLENLDPGGFTVLEHYWTRAGRGVEWIRALPFSFLLILMLSTAVLGRQLSGSWLVAVTGFSLPLVYPGALYFGIENRAYSMELAGVACGLVVLLRALKKGSISSFLLAGIVAAFFLTSRYSYMIFVISAGFTMLYAIPAGRDRAALACASRVAVYCVPVVAAGAVIFQYMLRHQLWPEMTGSGTLGVTAPVYVKTSVLAGNEHYLDLLRRNVASLPAVPISLSMVYFLFVQGPLHRRLLREHPGMRLDFRTAPVFVFVLAFQSTAFVFSYLGVYPWDIGARWSAHLLAVSMIAALAIAAEAMMLWQARQAVVPASGKRPAARVARPAATICILAFTGFAVVHAAGYRISKTTTWPDVSSQIRQYHASARQSGRLFVTWYEVPAVRYLHEFGPFRELPGYPERFRFETEAEWRSQRIIDVAEADIRYIVSAKPREELQERFPDNRLTEIAPGRNPLLGIGERLHDTR